MSNPENALSGRLQELKNNGKSLNFQAQNVKYFLRGVRRILKASCLSNPENALSGRLQELKGAFIIYPEGGL